MESAAFNERQSYPQFLRFLFPSIISMITLSFYTTVDGFFVSRFVGANALAAINIIVPLTCVFYGIALMLASGAGALIAIKLGEQKKKEADSLFSFTLLALFAIGLILTFFCLFFLNPILKLLGSTDILMPYTRIYGFLTALMTIPMMFKLFLEHFARIDGNPSLAFFMSTSGLFFNIVFDYLFIAPMDLGILGAALGTFLSILLSEAIGIVYFLSKRSNLRLTKPLADGIFFVRSCINGSSQMLIELSTGIITFLFNISILKYQGEIGIAAVSILMFIYYFLVAIYMGVSVGASPIISYSYGAKNDWRTRLVLRHSYISLAWMSIVIFLLSLTGREFMIKIFTEDTAVIQVAKNGMFLFSWCFLFTGINIFISTLFTSIGNGRIAGILSLFRCLIFASAAIIMLPKMIGEAGIWIAVPVAEFLTLFLSAYYYKRNHCAMFPNSCTDS
ncbi:MATE family efflux transporter [Sinanaerobacter sp. ZZT-01]|uniref:MATE family efflux transporter n=1 Tax=Sinanaerobacter sp. ZZT-01 TaxID=3111540 RepID=UPI002D796604|nr:MATE family efflux transporter [Sinanaerobacter sp. ZZT-01]WRR94501.1 MATE family efflux transporter [Sinanaerobacter sp. ZZT-01]